MTEPEGTELYGRIVSHDYGDPDTNALMLKVWSVTPFVVDFYTDSINSDRELRIKKWLRDKHGPEAWPIHGREGLWQFGSATIHGWTHVGFARRRDLDEFLEHWRSADWRAADDVGR